MPLALPRRRSPPSPVNLHESESNRAYSEHQNEERPNGGERGTGDIVWASLCLFTTTAVSTFTPKFGQTPVVNIGEKMQEVRQRHAIAEVGFLLRAFPEMSLT